MKNLRALLFDFDGLLIDTESAEFRAMCELYEQHGHVLDLATWSRAIGTIGGFDPAEHLRSLGSAPAAEAFEEQKRRVLELCELEDFLPGVDALLDIASSRGLLTCIVSSSSREWIEGHLRRRSGLERFDAIVCANGDPARAKPRPTLYLEALETLDVHADEAMAFEDSPNGIAAAKAAGIYCVAVPNPVTAGLDLAKADLVLESLADFDLSSVP
ncbi:MAG: HAD-IA family hydrolase [Vulcanimicrobiaceae bacterium]|jgi:HAD superfamily hydrolase (TIGR01509 family)